MSQIGMSLLLVGCGGGFSSTDSSSVSKSDDNSYVTPIGKVCDIPSDVGRVSLHRLNRVEYNNSVRDLFGVTSSPADSFPEDGFAESFNNNADVLFVNTDLMEKYVTAAETVAAQALQINKASLLTCTSTSRACLTQILTPIAKKVFRRPASTQELDGLIAVAQYALGEGENLEASIEQSLQAMLVSPHFLFRRIQHAQPDQAKAVTELNDYELASRLSYFLWSSTPDDTLLNLADQAKLRDKDVLKQQVTRMLQSEKSKALVDHFVSQWLQLYRLDQSHPDSSLYPDFTSALKQDMITETKNFMSHILEEDRSLIETVSANYSFVNSRLATHYGLSGVNTNQSFQKTAVDQVQRQGILGHASILTLTSHPTAPSIVHRGKWILKNLLCDMPPPPPPNLPAPDQNLTESQRSQQRMSNPACLSCHSQMDPLGTGLQMLDAIGQWRILDEGGKSIDASGSFPDGRKFEGPQQLADIIAEDPRLKQCMTEKMLTYALGRELQNYDQCTVNKLALENVKADLPASKLIEAIVTSPLFMQQRGDGGQL